MKIYLAGPFFTDKQKDIVSQVERIIKHNGFEVYSPMKECIFEKGVTKPADIFDDNVKQIDVADAVIVITDGKDVGTLFEAGFAYGKGSPIIYAWFDSNGAKFNIMLKESAAAIALSYTHLDYTLNRLSKDRCFVTHPDVVDMELE